MYFATAKKKKGQEAHKGIFKFSKITFWVFQLRIRYNHMVYA